MLLNLDLFRSQIHQGDARSPGSNVNDSTLDQIRTLNALGYLGNSNYTGAGDRYRDSGEATAPVPPAALETPE
jgi:hypothetical protein